MAALVSTPALADDWVATRLRGVVLVLIEGDWVKLKRGEIVGDDRVIRTLRGGRVTFERGAEVIELGGDTQVQIIDRTGTKFTTVQQYFGSVAVEAEARQVQHFSVQTPHLAAVVKGTRFVVTSDRTGARVEVRRGRVAVEDRDTRQSTVVSAGQAASTSDGAALIVSGRGKMPVVYQANGKPVEPKLTRRGGKEAAAAAEQARAAAIASGMSSKEAEKAAREAAKEARSEAASGSESRRGGNSGNGNGSGGGNAGNGNGNAGGGESSGNGNSGRSDQSGAENGNSGNGNSNSGNGNGNGNSGNGKKD